MRQQNNRNRDDDGRFTGRGDFDRGNDRDRDDQGRFMSHDYQRDPRYGRPSPRYGGDRDDSRFERGNDYDYRSGNRGNYRDRDDNGRFESRDDPRGGNDGGFRERETEGRFESRYDDRDERYSGERNYRGSDEGRWGRDESQGGGGYGDDSRMNHDNSHYGRPNYAVRDMGGGQGRGWHGDPEGHARAAQQRGNVPDGRGDRDDDPRDEREGLGQRGEGNQRGVSTREGGQEDHRGWYGDPRGHAQAARRGWQHRR